MNIALDAGFLCGVENENYIKDLLFKMIGSDTKNSYYLFNLQQPIELLSLPKDRIEEVYFYCGESNNLLNYPCFKRVIGSVIERFLEEYSIDIFIIGTSCGKETLLYERKWLKNVKSILVIYDNFLDENQKEEWCANRIKMLKGIDLCFVTSKAMKKTLIERFEFISDEIIEVGDGIGREFCLESAAERILLTVNKITDIKKKESIYNMAIFTPLPPIYSGISNYSKDIINELSKYLKIDVYIDGGYEADCIFNNNVHIYHHEEFEKYAEKYDAIVYQMGNAPYHTYMLPYIEKYSGCVVMHDINLHHLLGKMLADTKDYDRYERYLLEDFEPNVVREYIRKLKNGEVSMAMSDIHVNGFVVNHADRIIVHSMYGKKRLLEREIGRKVAHIKLYAKIENDYKKEILKEKYGFSKEEIVIASFGTVTPLKRNHEIIEALNILKDRFCNVKYVIVGGDTSPSEEYSRLCMETIKKYKMENMVRFTGYVSDEKFMDYMGLADICANLRYPYNGESSASFAQLLGMGKAVIVNKIGDFDEVPDNVCVKIPYPEGLTMQQEVEEISNAVIQLANVTQRKRIELNAFRYAKAELNIEMIGKKYLKFLARSICKFASDQDLNDIYLHEIEPMKYSQENIERLAETIVYGRKI